MVLRETLAGAVDDGTAEGHDEAVAPGPELGLTCTPDIS